MNRVTNKTNQPWTVADGSGDEDGEDAESEDAATAEEQDEARGGQTKMQDFFPLAQRRALTHRMSTRENEIATARLAVYAALTGAPFSRFSSDDPDFDFFLSAVKSPYSQVCFR